MNDKEFCFYEFGEFHLDTRRRSLSKNGEKVPIPARNFDLLLFMVENSGRILEHDELLEQVWAETFVEQATLIKGVSALRQILAEDTGHEFIKTIPRRGYSFVSPVRVVALASESFFLSEREREIAIEEYREIGDTEENPGSSENLGRAGATLPAVKTEKTSLLGRLVLSGAALTVPTLGFFGGKSYLKSSEKPGFSPVRKHQKNAALNLYSRRIFPRISRI